MNVDDLHPIEDYSPGTLRELIGRVENSRALEQIIYRESELDEVWRLLDGDIAAAARKALNSVEAQKLVAVRKLIIEAHDLIGNDSNTMGARERLLRALALV
ncbi:hypothetical protein [Paraburkholderia rhynchosiae]|uniref:Uncharacterized protein n=1 Tax=Paraburkholderia rhynchosiae TaxID=487049 RepID=A0A2N7WDL3_9BURK|nr:hypothetical protein [Paraburkholderia rhynchosiae]PMS27498.1 hypothetical protein C0Z16_24950 [Paraburkholderia rhynchosiae]CAB3723628.1 hypothetical protein LMG27174_05168 [Paraburkholderia rhynchosiae]